MLRKTLIVTLGFLGLVAAGTAAGTAPASAGHGCGPWNNWCRPVCGPWNGWCSAFFLYPRYSYGWYGYGGHHGHNNWGKSHGHNNWNGDRHNGNGQHNYQAYKNKGWNHYR